MKKSLLLTLFFSLLPFFLHAQDTVKVSLQEFISQGIKNSGQISYEKQKVDLAENKIDQANAKRWLPKFELSTQHGVVPGVESNTGLPPDEYYLDPNLENDWQNWAVFTRAEVKAVQPIFTWGALKDAVDAAHSAAVAARNRFKKQKGDLSLKLYDLYQSHILTGEILYLLHQARGQIGKIQDQIEKKKKNDAADFDESDYYKFKVYKSQFEIHAAEVKKNAQMTQRIWNYVMQADTNKVYVPDTQFLDPVPQKLKSISYYQAHAQKNRPEVLAINAGIKAARHGIKANKEKNLPSLFLGITGSYANTPNRPRQSNPFIINNSNYANGAVGIGIRQNLDFLSMKADVKKSRIQYRQAKYLKQAAEDGIVLEINRAYNKASLSKVKVEKTNEALTTSKKWLRQEQLNYDLDKGETKDLIDALKQELELRLKYKQEIFNFNEHMGNLYHKSGLSITQITTK